MKRQDPYAGIALPIQTGDPYADIATPIPTNRNRRQAPAAPGSAAPQNGEDAPFQPELAPGDNGIYPEMLPGSSRENPIDLTTIDRSTPEGRELLASLTRGMWVRGEDGTVYPLPSDPTEGQVRVGDEPVTPGVYVRPMSAVEDAAKSFPTGVVQGLTGMAGMQGTIGQMLGAEPGQYIPGFGVVGPTGEQINEEISSRFLGGEEAYQPQTVAGEYSRTAGEFLPGFAAPGGLGAKFASWLVPAVASETAGQGARLLEGGERGTALEGGARLAGGLLGGFGVGGVNAVRGGADISLRNAAQGVTPQQLEMAAALRRDAAAMGINNLSNANAVQQVTGGATGLGRLQRIVEGQTPRMNQYFSDLTGQVDSAITSQLDNIGPSVEPGQLAGQAREAANSVLSRTRARINAEARPFYGAADQQVISAEEYAALRELPTYRAAEEAFYSSPELSGGAGGPQSIEAVNRIIQQMDELARQADPGQMNAAGNRTLASTREQAAGLAKGLVDTVSPDYAQARAIGAAGRQNELAPIQRGPIGSIASQPELAPDLVATDARLFPPKPFEGQAAETARALELMGEVDPTVGGPLVRQHLARESMEALQRLPDGRPNQFGGANFAARTFGNPEQNRTIMGALDVVNRPDPNMAFPPLSQNATPARGSDPMARLVDVLRATGERHRQGSETAFNVEGIKDLRGGNAASETVRGLSNLLSIPGRIAGGIDDLTAQANANTLAEMLMANSDEFNVRLARAINRPRGANRIRAGVAVAAGQED